MSDIRETTQNDDAPITDRDRVLIERHHALVKEIGTAMIATALDPLVKNGGLKREDFGQVATAMADGASSAMGFLMHLATRGVEDAEERAKAIDDGFTIMREALLDFLEVRRKNEHVKLQKDMAAPTANETAA